MNTELLLLLLFLLFLVLFSLTIIYFIYGKKAKAKTTVSKKTNYHHCDPQYGPDYLAFDNEPKNELIKTYTSTQCKDASLCWDDDFEKCFGVR